ncbi:DNA ligase 3-like [Pezoporus occidentalis]|uniref:DNA ligase 3-like n=1 Tax=Pezoporus occidentalis TaxID=407982 RepID=UPI002F9166C7
MTVDFFQSLLIVLHKAAFQDANVCLFVFDCIYFSDVSLMDRPLCEHCKFLYDNTVEIPDRLLFSEMKHVTKALDLADTITHIIREGLEGLVLKDIKAGSYLLFTGYAGSWGVTAGRSVDEAHKAEHPGNLWVLTDADIQSKLLLIDVSTAVLLQC